MYGSSMIKIIFAVLLFYTILYVGTYIIDNNEHNKNLERFKAEYEESNIYVNGEKIDLSYEEFTERYRMESFRIKFDGEDIILSVR